MNVKEKLFHIFYVKSLIFFVVLFEFFISISVSAGILKKETYSISPEIKYKDDLNIAIFPFSGELPGERKYVKDLIRNTLGDNILLYKKILFDLSFIDFKRTAFNSSDKELKEGNKIDNIQFNDILNNNRFLELKLIEDKDLNAVKTVDDIESREWVNFPGMDIIIAGTVVQNKNNIKVKLKVFNNIYVKIVNIEKEGTFKNIDRLIEEISNEAIKSIIIHYSCLNILCEEKGSYIYIDGRHFGRTDKSGIILESGNHNILVSKEDIAWKTLQIDIKEGASESIRVEFGPEDIYTRNSIRITTIPDKARVYLDSKFIGLSPVAKNDVLNGVYRVRVEKGGYIAKYSTVEISNDKDSKKELEIIMEKGDSKEYYFSRTTVYHTLFKCSVFGMALSSASYIYFGLKINDENTKLDDLSSEDSNYQSKKSKIKKERDNFLLYRQISLYTLGAMIISTGLFYYLNIAQDDVAIAMYLPQKDYLGQVNLSYYNYKDIGFIFSKSF